jgi:hypothetical protein
MFCLGKRRCCETTGEPLEGHWGKCPLTRRRGVRGGGELTREIEDITGEIVDAAYKLHAGLGPGLLERIVNGYVPSF